MDDKLHKRAHNRGTLVYGASSHRMTLVAAVPPVPAAHPVAEVAPVVEVAPVKPQCFEPPAERPLPPAVLPVGLAPRHGTMALPARKRRGGTAFHWMVMTGLLAIAIVSHLDRLQSLFAKVVPANDVVEVQGAIPLMLFVRSDPPASRVLINGHHVGRTPFAQGYTSVGGKVHVRVEAPGYEAWESELQYKPAGVLVTAKLHRLQKLKPMMIVAMH